MVNVLEMMASTIASPGKPFLKETKHKVIGNVTHMVGLTGSVKESVALSFAEDTIFRREDSVRYCSLLPCVLGFYFTRLGLHNHAPPVRHLES